jgi:protein gp37
MGEVTKIAWTEATMNPWIGCTHMSPGCENCYAEASYFVNVQRGRGQELWGAKADRRPASEATWHEPHKWNRKAYERGHRMRVFCASLADVFEMREDLDVHRARLFDTIRRTPNLDWQILTKRMNMNDIMFLLGRAMAALSKAPVENVKETADWIAAWISGRPPLNVWLGCTVEDQKRATQRGPQLLAMPAALRFLSMEPLLERVDVEPALGRHGWASTSEARVDWIIVGGESGKDARPFDISWARDVVSAGAEAKCPVFVKQMGDNAVLQTPGSLPIAVEGVTARKGGDTGEWPPDLVVRQMPISPMGEALKKRIGREVCSA